MEEGERSGEKDWKWVGRWNAWMWRKGGGRNAEKVKKLYMVKMSVDPQNLCAELHKVIKTSRLNL